MLLEVNKKILGEKFKKYRKYKNLTQFQLAERVGLNEKQISRIEAGLNHPTFMTFAKLIDVLDINIAEFLIENEVKTNKMQDDLIKIIKNSSDFELKIYFDVIKSMKKHLKSLKSSSV